MKLNPEQVRRGLRILTDLGGWVEKLTPTSMDDQCFAFLRALNDDPDAIEKACAAFNEKAAPQDTA